MSRPRTLGILAVRWLGLAFLSLAFTMAIGGLVGPWTMGGMMGGSALEMAEPAAGMGASGHMMTRGLGMWWGTAGLVAVVVAVLWAASRPLGAALASGLDP